MSDGIRDLMAPMRIHQAVVVEFNSATIYGRIWDFEGSEYDSIHAIVVVKSPEASMVKAGRCWVRPLSTQEEFAKLYEFESEARSKGRWYSDNSEKLK